MTKVQATNYPPISQNLSEISKLRIHQPFYRRQHRENFDSDILRSNLYCNLRNTDLSSTQIKQNSSSDLRDGHYSSNRWD